MPEGPTRTFAKAMEKVRARTKKERAEPGTSASEFLGIIFHIHDDQTHRGYFTGLNNSQCYFGASLL